LTGIAAMGMEIVWFRHFRILLGEFRSDPSRSTLAVILIGIIASARIRRWRVGVSGGFRNHSAGGLNRS
jgi:hypothetical protein